MPSISFSSIVKSRSNPFLEQTSTKQYKKSFLLKETTGAFYRTRTHYRHITSKITHCATPPIVSFAFK